MSGTLAGIAYIWLAQGLAFLLMPRSIELRVRSRALAFWLLTAPIVLLIPTPMTALLAVAVVMLALSPIDALHRVAFFVVAVPAVPVFLTAQLPFPGINYLTSLTHYKLAATLVLIPTFLAARDSTNLARPGLPLASFGLVAYVMYQTILIGGSYGFTGGLRHALDLTLFLIVPFFAILLTLRKLDDVEQLFQAVLIASLLLATVAVVSSLKRWDIYASAASVIGETRDGVFRINATAGTHSLAFHLACGILALEFLRFKKHIPWLSLNIMRFVLLAGMTTTDSRGAAAGLAVALCIYLVLILRSGALRQLLIWSVFLGLAAGAIWLAQGDVDAVDVHGTFTYRQELFWTSLEYIQRYPLLGDRHFLLSGHFDHLLQGQGIIDITNLYLQVTLTFGLLGLALFASVFVMPFVKLGLTVNCLRRSQSNLRTGAADSAATDLQIWTRAAAVVASIGAGWLFLIVTTSDVGLTMHLGTIFAAMCCAMRRIQPASRPVSTSAHRGRVSKQAAVSPA